MDTDNNHDHTYYGNGCLEGGTGSATSCSTRIVKTIDNENQIIGVYYSFQAATSGSGGAIVTPNANSPDTFCPLGWQLPYSGKGGDYYDKSRSFRYLLDSYSIAYDPGETIGAQKIKSYPISYSDAGFSRGSDGHLYYQGIYSTYWSSTILGTNTVYNLYAWASGLRPDSDDTKTGRLPFRCVICMASGKLLEFEKQKSRAFVLFADPTRRRGAHQRGAP